MKNKILKSILLSIVSFSSFSSDEMHVTSAFESYVQSSKIDAELFHTIQSVPFMSDGIQFTYCHQDLYNINNKSTYPHYEPMGLPSINSVMLSPTINTMNISWLTKDSPTPGMNTPFFMTFHIKKLDLEQFYILPSLSIKAQSSFQNLNHLTSSTFPVKTYLLKMGYDGKNFDFPIFARWFAKSYLGYEKGNRLGFNTQGLPIIFNLMSSEAMCSYLHIFPHFYTSVAYTSGFMNNDLEDLEDQAIDLVKQIPLTFKKEQVIPENRVRHKLYIKEKCIVDERGHLVTEEDVIYAIDQYKNIFIQNKDYGGHHPSLLRGKTGLCAGHISFVDGKIVFLSNNTGHYRAHTYHLLKTIQMLDKDLFSKNCIIRCTKTLDFEDFVVDTFLVTFSSKENKLRDDWIIESEKRIESDFVYKKMIEVVEKN